MAKSLIISSSAATVQPYSVAKAWLCVATMPGPTAATARSCRAGRKPGPKPSVAADFVGAGVAFLLGFEGGVVDAGFAQGVLDGVDHGLGLGGGIDHEVCG